MIVDLKPSGQDMAEDLHAAGGGVKVLAELADCLDLGVMTLTGQNWQMSWPRPLRTGRRILSNRPADLFMMGLAVLYGNLADGAIIKQAAASAHLLSHTGRAVVFEDMADLAARIDSPDLDVEEDDILVLRQIGPKGPRMPEAGLIDPEKLAQCRG